MSASINMKLPDIMLWFEPGDSYLVLVLVMTCFLIRDHNILPKKELHGSFKEEQQKTRK